MLNQIRNKSKIIFDPIENEDRDKDGNDLEIVLPFGKTGWGKSTSASFLDGIPLITTSTGNLKPRNYA